MAGLERPDNCAETGKVDNVVTRAKDMPKLAQMRCASLGRVLVFLWKEFLSTMPSSPYGLVPLAHL